MTKFQKQMLTIAAAGALTAVTALPALAFENEFHGLFNFNTAFSNFNTGATGDFKPNQATWGDNRKMNNYLEQRTRIFYTAKASDDLKLVTGFEMNTRFGNTSSTAGSGTGGRLDTDMINIVTKWAYLDFNVGKNFNTKLGQMAYKDTIKGLFIDADVPAVMTTTKLGNYTLGLGFSRFAADDGTPLSTTTSRIGDANKDLFIMDNTYAFNKDTKVNLSYYLMADYSSIYGANNGAANSSAAIWQLNTANNQRTILHTLGLSGETKLGGLNLSGFAAIQAGIHNNGPAAIVTPSSNFHGWAANVAANMKLGNGTAKTAFLYTSGNNSTNAAQFNGWVSSSVNSYNEGGMMILARNTGNSPTSTDQYIRRDVTNIALLTAGYDAMLTDKMSLNTNVGFAWAPATASIYGAGGTAYDNGAPVDVKMGSSRNGSDFMGAEINVEAGYQLYKNLKVLAQGGYMILGGYYKNSTYKNGAAPIAANAVDPENPYTMRLQARYSF